MTAYLIPILESMKRHKYDTKQEFNQLYEPQKTHYYDLHGFKCIDRADQDNRNWEIQHDQRNGN